MQDALMKADQEELLTTLGHHLGTYLAEKLKA